ncbi:hypothetical protein [Pseudomonas oryzihabitans]|nr:hypothetical protein [Pseudomonas oryzihabitans]
MTTTSWSRRAQAVLSFGRRGLGLTWSLLWPFLLAVSIALGFVLVAAWGFGDLQSYRQWQADHHTHFLVWRTCLYAGLVTFWWPCRKRLIAANEDRGRLYRCEVMAVLVIGLFELRNAGML